MRCTETALLRNPRLTYVASSRCTSTSLLYSRQKRMPMEVASVRCTNTYLVRNAVVALIQRTRTSCQLILRGCACPTHSYDNSILCAKPPRCQQISAPLVQLAAVITPEPVRPLETLVPLVVWASGKASRTRIRDRPIMSRLLYRLSYSPAGPLPRATLGITALRGYRFTNVYRPKIPTHVASICLHLSFAHE